MARTTHGPTLIGDPSSFLYQMDHLGQENYVPNPVLEKALDVLFLLHADHELNASSTTVLQTGSSLVDPYSAIASVSPDSLFVHRWFTDTCPPLVMQCRVCFALVSSISA